VVLFNTYLLLNNNYDTKNRSTEIEGLKRYKKLGIDQDGDFGGLTDAAVKKKRNGLTEDGEVGTSTAAKMGIDLVFEDSPKQLTMEIMKPLRG
jgi:peptidoglycan hydrolase-like protein with peptidoglycan-binding domain